MRERGVVMRVGIRLVERDRALEIGERLVLLIERLARGTTADMGPDVIGPQRQRAIKSRNRLGGAGEPHQRAASVEVGLRVRGHDRKHRIILGECALEAPERRQRIAAIGARAGKARRQRQRSIECHQRLGRPVELHEHVAAIADRLQRAGHQRDCLVEDRQRLLIAVERSERHAEIGHRQRGSRIELERLLEVAAGGAGLAALQLDDAKKMQRVEPVGPRAQHTAADLLRVGEPTLAIEPDGLLDRLRQQRRARTQILHRFSGRGCPPAGPWSRRA